MKDDRVLSSLDSVKRLSNEEKVKEILTKYGAIEPGVRTRISQNCPRISLFKVDCPLFLKLLVKFHY